MSVKSLISTGTKVWLDGVEPDQIKSNRALGITGATSNPTIIVEALAGSDIQANPPATNEAVQRLNKQYTRRVDQMLPQDVLNEIGARVDMKQPEYVRYLTTTLAKMRLQQAG